MNKNIVNEIQREIRSQQIKDIKIDGNYLNFYINLLKLDPNWGLSSGGLHNRLDLQRFIKYIVNKQVDESNPETLTCKLQYYFEEKFINLLQLPSLKRKEFMTKLSPLKMKSLEKPKDASNSIKAIVAYITLASGLGNPMDLKVNKETEKALRSLWSEIDQFHFFNHKYFIREELLDSLIAVTSGIRLYNMDCNKGGQGIPPLPDLLFQAAGSVEECLDEASRHLIMRMNYLSSVLETCYEPIHENFGVVYFCKVKTQYSLSLLEYSKDLYIFDYQFFDFMRKLCDAVNNVRRTSQITLERYNNVLNILHELVIPDIHISCKQVFPIFTQLYGYWMKFQDQVMILSGIKDIFDEMYDIICCLFYSPEEIDELVCRKQSSPNIENNFSFPVNPDAKVFNKRNLSMLHSAIFEFNGFCPWSLVSTNGMLRKGSDKYDIVLYNKKLYKFSSSWGLQSFIREPDYYINSVYHIARRKPQLISFLRLKDRLRDVSTIKELVIQRKIPKETRQIEVQTETHPILENIDIDYHWNIWDRRRKLIELANFTDRTSKRTQTKKCMFITDQECQVYPKKQKGTQTPVSNYTNVPKLFSHLCGLRGRRDRKQVILRANLPEIK